MNEHEGLGQFRKSMYFDPVSGQPKDFLIKKEIQIQDKETSGAYSDAIIFKDKMIVLTDSRFDIDHHYYCDLKIKQTKYEQVIKVYLMNNEVKEKQHLYTYIIQPGNSLFSSELVFTPVIEGCNAIVLELQRTSLDYQAGGRNIELGPNEILGIYEIINILQSEIGVSGLTKIGIQGPSGLLMDIDGEGIRVGPSGIYEPICNMGVKFVGFIIKNKKIEESVINEPNDYFIMDYQY